MHASVKASVSVHTDSAQRLPVLLISRVAGVRHGVHASVKASVSVHTDSGQRLPLLVISRVAGVRHGVHASVKASVSVHTDSAQRLPVLLVWRVVGVRLDVKAWGFEPYSEFVVRNRMLLDPYILSFTLKTQLLPFPRDGLSNRKGKFSVLYTSKVFTF
ncbi:hypothetical protein AVEN_141778-1 [Araneus ventricosus]|uniref:Uncharacterized protein n=1 Tax=Araneus ventricosus TaxID=182803 RepID=A0A4Y2S5X4_ARAVE|nr:hypothetical protein AVEN_141778-1 [Araneus ventricosus]